MPPNQSQSVFSTGNSRSSVQIVDSRRNMKMFDLNKNEIQTLASWNTQTLAAFSIGSFAFSEVFSILLTLATANPWGPVDSILLRYVLPLSTVVTIGSYAVGYMLKKSCGEIIRTVEEETQDGSLRTKRRRSGSQSAPSQ